MPASKLHSSPAEMCTSASASVRAHTDLHRCHCHSTGKGLTVTIFNITYLPQYQPPLVSYSFHLQTFAVLHYDKFIRPFQP